MFVRRLLLFLLLSVGCMHAASPKWEKLEGCQLMENTWNDGDSFHVRYNGEEYIFRLYFVDTPETDSRFPERVSEQAAAFGITTDQALDLGKKAKKFTADVLGARTFTVWTCWQKALGSSHLQRWYALLETKQGWLDQLLVKNRLARIYGKRVSLPDGRDSREYLAELQAMQPSK